MKLRFVSPRPHPFYSFWLRIVRKNCFSFLYLLFLYGVRLAIVIVNLIFLCYILIMKKYGEMSFKEIVENIEALKDKYDLAFMSLFNCELISKWKTFIYSFDIKEWQKDRIWECLNDDIEIEELQNIVNFEKVKK